METLKLRTSLAILGIVAIIALLVPNIVNMDGKWWFSHSKLNYGLDIQGGLNLVMGVDVQGVISESTNRLVSSLKAEFAKENIPVTDVVASQLLSGEIAITFANAADTKEKITKMMSDRYSTTLQEMESAEGKMTYRYYESYVIDYKKKVIQQSIETIRNRIDEFGVSEPSITQQGEDRILVQLPGMADAERAKQLINTTAKLDFMMVSYEKNPQELQALIAEVEKAGGYSIDKLKYSEYVAKINQDLQGKIPAKTVVYFQKPDNVTKIEAGAVPFLLQTDTGLTGDSLSDAFVSYDQYGNPQVAIRFNTSGANKFAEITGANINKQMAIVLDKVVKSAPNIKDRISGGEAVVTLGSKSDKVMDEAKMIATALRAGSLPATLEQLEERRVGPTLGSDSINKAKLASWVGALLIALFMFFYYKGMGLIANISLAVNISSLLALLTSFGATLTLPGIAGIALTVGFAVDANVLINERIREELAKGSSLKHAIQEGYHLAMSAILDANITTAATALVLLYFGTGPVKGFAVTLLIGIVTTMFANVFVSKVLVDNLLYKFNIKKISV